MKFQVIQNTEVTTAIEVELPRYAKHDLDSCTIYYKVVGGLTSDRAWLYSITIANGEQEVRIEYEALRTNLGRDGDYYLGLKDKFKSCEEDWNNALAVVDRAIGRIKQRPPKSP